MHILFGFSQFAMLQRDEFVDYCDVRGAPPLELDFAFDEDSDSDSDDQTPESTDSLFIRRSLEADLEAHEMLLQEITYDLSVLEGQLKTLQQQEKDQ